MIGHFTEYYLEGNSVIGRARFRLCGGSSVIALVKIY